MHMGGFLKCGYHNSWMVYFMENPPKIWIRTGGTPILGNHHMIQNVKRVLQTNVFPDFQSWRCRSMFRLGFKNGVVGIPRSLSSKHGCYNRHGMEIVCYYFWTSIFTSPPLTIQSPPQLTFDQIDELSCRERFNVYTRLMKPLRNGRSDES